VCYGYSACVVKVETGASYSSRNDAKCLRYGVHSACADKIYRCVTGTAHAQIKYTGVLRVQRMRSQGGDRGELQFEKRCKVLEVLCTALAQIKYKGVLRVQRMRR
jgi:hypothetical protein